MISKQDNFLIPEIFACTITLIAGILIYFSRINFDNNFFLIIKSISISFIIIFSPYLLKKLIINNKMNFFFISKSLLLFIVLTIISLIGYFSIKFDINVGIFLFLIGFTLFIFFFIEVYKMKLEINYILLILFVILSIWITSVYYDTYYLHPLMKEKVVLGAWAHRDAVWHATLSGIFKTYSVSSTGLDGLISFKYHNFSHLIYGLFSGVLSINSLDFNAIVAPIIFLPIFFLSFLFCINEIGDFFHLKQKLNKFKFNEIRFWILFTILFTLPLPKYWLPETYQYITSQSYFMAFIFTFILFGSLFSIINKYISKVITNIDSIILIILPILSYCIIYSKISFLYVISILYIYIFFRLKLFKRKLQKILLIVMSSLFVFIYFDLVLAFSNEFPSNNWKSDYLNLIISYPYYIYLSLFYIFIKIWFLRINSRDKLIKNFNNFNIIDLEILFILIFALFIIPYDYFKGIQIHFANILILSNSKILFDLLKNNNIKKKINV